MLGSYSQVVAHQSVGRASILSQLTQIGKQTVRRGEARTFAAPDLRLRSQQSWNVLACAYFVLGVACLWLESNVQGSDWQPHAAFCVIGILLAAIKFALDTKFLRRNPGELLCDYRYAFLVSFTVYFCLGALFVFSDNTKKLAEVSSIRPIDAALAMRVDAINALGLALALGTFAMMQPRLLPAYAQLSARFATRVFGDGLFAALLLLVLGLIGRVVVTHNDWYQGEVISGLWRKCATLLYAYLLVVPLYQGRHRKKLLVIAAAVCICASLVGVLSANKSDAAFPLLALGLGSSIRHGSLQIAAATLLGVAGYVQVLGGPTTYARIHGRGVSSFDGRIELMQDGFRASRGDNPTRQYSVWARFCYLHSQGRAVVFYDDGRGGNDIDKAPWIFVPRFIYPNKPVMTTSGAEFFRKISGHTGSSEGRGVFVDGYYNCGWAGVVGGGVIVGFVLAQLSSMARAVLHGGAVIMVPLVFLGLYVALRADGDLLADYAGTYVMIACLLGVAGLALRTLGDLPGLRRPEPIFPAAR